MFKIKSFPDFPDIKIIVSPSYGDHRGYFCETFRDTIPGLPKFVQENTSISHKGTIRGLHYQINPHAQAKLVTCLSGNILDVFLDLRKKSITYGKHGTIELSGFHTSLFIPEGFAHGFRALKDDTIVSYKVSNFYSPEHERCIIYNDPDLDIDWNFNKLKIYNYITSVKDRTAPLLKDAENNF